MAESLGLMTSCAVCGGANTRTGKERLGPHHPPAFGAGPGYRIRSEEFLCTACGRRVWAESGTDETPPTKD